MEVKGLLVLGDSGKRSASSNEMGELWPARRGLLSLSAAFATLFCWWFEMFLYFAFHCCELRCKYTRAIQPVEGPREPSATGLRAVGKLLLIGVGALVEGVSHLLGAGCFQK